MDPTPESSYFASLENCVNGEEVIISWKSLFSAITQDAEPELRTEDVIRSFLSNQEVLNLLSKPFEAFPKPSSSSKAAFDTKSSAINASPSPDAQYDIEEIKKDALWLSKETNLNELTALRIVVVECQARSRIQLLGPFSEEELMNVREAAEVGKYAGSQLSELSYGSNAVNFQKEFNDEQNRHQRILHVYLSEKRHFLKCSEICFETILANAYRDDQELLSSAWLVDILSPATRLFIRRDATNELLLSGIGYVIETAHKLNAGSGWVIGDIVPELLEIDWYRSQIIEAIHSMELIWLHIHYVVQYPSSEVALQWCSLLQDYTFFDRFDTNDRLTKALWHSLQSISAIISISIFSDSNSLTLLAEPQPPSAVPPNPTDQQKQMEKEKREAYASSPRTVTEIHAVMLRAADIGCPTVGPMVLAWSVFLTALKLRVIEDQEAAGDEENAPSRYEALLDEINNTMDDDMIDFLGRKAINQCRVFETLSSISLGLGNNSNSGFSFPLGSMMRIYILDLIRDVANIGYLPEMIEAILAALSAGQNYWEIASSPALLPSEDPVLSFMLLGKDVLEGLLKSARQRFPLESLPFLKLVRAIASSPLIYGAEESSGLTRVDHLLLNFLQEMPFFTYAFPPDFVDYETINEEENNNNIRLTQPIQLFEPRARLGRGRGQQIGSMALVKADQFFLIPAGTCGRIISDSGPRIGFWFHQYSALQYFGKLLETFLAASDQVDAITGTSTHRDSVSEIIGLFALLVSGNIRSSIRNAEWYQEVIDILDQAKSGLSRNRDIITIIFEIFEQELYQQSASPGSEASLDILVACVSFMHAILPVEPGRVWPMLARSGLLEVSAGNRKLSSIVEGTELLSGQYAFLTSCCYLFEALIDDFSSNAVKRKINSNATARFSGISQTDSCVPEQTLSRIILSFSRYLIDVLETSSMWKFVSPDEHRLLNDMIASILNKVLHYSFGIDSAIQTADENDGTPVRKQFLKANTVERDPKELRPLMGALLPAATLIVDSFLSPASGSSRFQSLLRSYFDGLETPSCTVYLNQSDLWRREVRSVLVFTKTLLRVNVFLGRPSSQLEKYMFKASPIIARLYATDDSYRSTVMLLLKSLVEAAANETCEPPSLLGHLGPQTTQNFIGVLVDLNKPLLNTSDVTSIWGFLAAVVSCRQQWFANYLLNGRRPRTLMGRKGVENEPARPSKSFLALCLKSLTNILSLPRIEALAILEFVALAQNFWPWTVCDAPEYPDFIHAILAFVAELAPPNIRKASLEELVQSSVQVKIAAYIAEVLAMHFFHSRQTGRSVGIDKLHTDLSFFERFAALVPAYNASLHTFLGRNFERKFAGCTLKDLKHTTLDDHQLGYNFFYDLSLAGSMLGQEEGWVNKSSDGMEIEFQRANVNFSLVDAHIALFHSWKFLAIELSNRPSPEPEVQKLFVRTATACLLADNEPQPPEEIFSNISQDRVDLALVLTQRLVQVDQPVQEIKDLLATVCNAVRAFRGSFERPVPDANMAYYRSLLKLLFLVVRVHAEAKQLVVKDDKADLTQRAKQQTNVIPLILDIIKHVVSIGLREIATVIHEAPANSSPEDLALITGILQSCLRVPGIDSCHSQIVTIMANNGTARVALNLFSWSDNISIEGDPIYGELSMLFLLELSSIPLMAEQLALNGILNDISTANIASYLRGKGVSPFATGTGFQRCYSIWVRGILPLLLNILDAVQASIACEIALFLNQFSNLLAQCEESLSAPLMNRLPNTGPKKYITLTICSEVNSMALLSYILNGFREVLRGNVDVPELRWDAGAVLENVEFWLNSSVMLRERLLPMGERETELARKKLPGGVVSKLEDRVVMELQGIRDVLLTGADR